MNQITDEENKIHDVYKITNVTNNKSYIGVAKKWVKLAKQKYYMYGSQGRFKRHISNAFSTNEKCANDCPEFYKAIREFGANNFHVEVLKTITDNVKKYEEEEIIKYKTHDPEFGYNVLLSVKKPITEQRKNTFEKKKEQANKNRSVNGEMRNKEHNKNLPINIYYRSNKDSEGNIKHEGYFVQIKTDGKLINKAFLSDKLTMEEKLNKAKEFLDSLKINNNEILDV
jgi:hypothetical protein